MFITNFKKLAKNPLRKKALLIAEAGYGAIDIQKVVNSKCEVLSIKGKNFLAIRFQGKNLKINLDDFNRVFIVGVGKGSALASATLAKILGKRLTGGIALDVKKIKNQNSKLKTYVGTHPLPSQKNVKATKEIIKLAKGLKKDDLLITFICGGGSALL